MKKRALISVSDKTGIVELTTSLIKLGYEVISTGGTQALLEKENLPVQNISAITNFPEIMDGRVKTLHPAVHGGLLAVRTNEQHKKQLQDNNLEYIDIVVVNLYPFKETITKEGVTYEEAIENIDIGGPSMLRSAAKNHQAVTVVTDPSDYERVVDELTTLGDTTYALRQALAVKVFQTTAAYDAMIAEYFATAIGATDFPELLTLTYEKQQTLRYGENPQQHAAFYRTPLAEHHSLAYATQLQGKELSYNNIQDANAALEVMDGFAEPVVIALKHMNPCGVGTGKNLQQAWEKAYAADPISIFGGIIATNQVIDEQTALAMSKIFLEVIIAPAFTSEAKAIFAKKKNVRLLENPTTSYRKIAKYSLTSVNGGLLVQTKDNSVLTVDDLTVVTKVKPTTEQLEALLFAWNVVKHVKSNAIVIAKNGQTLGIGAGQMNRVGAAQIALEQAGEKAQGNVMSSDAFFPMSDTVELAAKAGIAAIIQPGGSIKDADSIAAADEHGIVMVFTGIRHFKH